MSALGTVTTPPRPPVERPVFPERVKSPQRAVTELVAVVLAIVALALVTGTVDVVVFATCVVVIVMLHELGHLLAAKHGGMKVTEYFLGFGPRLWSFRRGETEYGVKAFPLGGYVKIPGMTNLEEVDPADEARTYREQPFHARLLVAVAGSAMHFLIAFVLFWVLLVAVGQTDASRVQVQGLVTVAGHPGPAAVAGLRSGDIVVSVDGQAVRGDQVALGRAIQHHAGRPVTMVVDRDGRTVTLSVTPPQRPDGEGAGAHPAGRARPLRGDRCLAGRPHRPGQPRPRPRLGGGRDRPGHRDHGDRRGPRVQPVVGGQPVRPGRLGQGRRPGQCQRHPGAVDRGVRGHRRARRSRPASPTPCGC